MSLLPGSSPVAGAGHVPSGSQFVSADGRFVVFLGGTTLIGGTSGTAHVLVRDRVTGTTEAASVDGQGVPKPGGGYGAGITRDGRFVVFESAAPDLVTGDTNTYGDVFLRDRISGITERVSLNSTGVQANARSFYPSVSDDGRFVAFDSLATNLVAGDTNGKSDVFLRDRLLGTTECVSVSSTGAQGDGDSWFASISGNGRFIAFTSRASTLVPGDTNGRLDAFVRDRLTGNTLRASVAWDGTEGDGDSSGGRISQDGTCMSFTSAATNLVPGLVGVVLQAYVRDLSLGTTELVSVAPDGTPGNSFSQSGNLSHNGGLVYFGSAASNLVPTPSPNSDEAYVRDMRTGQTWAVSTTTSGGYSNGVGGGGSLSADGRFVVFESWATDLGPTDTNGTTDIFIKDRIATGFTSLCHPGQGNVLACPCGNPPGSPDRGCNNSSATGGAVLAASGIAYLSLDTLVFTTSGQKPSSTSILLQGNASAPAGLVFGQGVRCASGTLKRLYAKAAVAGTIVAPDPNTSDPSVSARSTQLGLPIQPGVAYAYLVYYRDAVVLGGCPASSTFNATQSGSIQWWP